MCAIFPGASGAHSPLDCQAHLLASTVALSLPAQARTATEEQWRRARLEADLPVVSRTVAERASALLARGVEVGGGRAVRRAVAPF